MAELRKETRSSAASFQDFGRLFEAKGFAVFDPNDEKIGKIDDVFVGGDNQPRYLGVKIGLLGTMTFMPVQLLTRLDPDEKAVWVSIAKETAKAGPVFERDHKFTPEDEAKIWEYYGLGTPVYVETEIFVWRQAS